MSLFSSSHFASAAASGTDWRDTAKAVLEKLEDVRSDDYAFTIGFLYISDQLADDVESILNLFKSVLGIEKWVGCVGIGICGNGESFIDKPAISAMVGCVDKNEFTCFPGVSQDISAAMEVLNPWIEANQSMLVLTHGDPKSDHDLIDTIERVGDLTQGFVIGGLTSSRTTQVQIAQDIYNGGLSGAVFSSDVKVATSLSQGCYRIGDAHLVTRSDERTVIELDSRKAVDVFEDDLRLMAIKKIDRDPDEIMVDQDNIPEEFQALFEGEVHVALPVTESDQDDFLVRHITGLDQDEGSLTLATMINNGERLLFVKRDSESIMEDMRKSLEALKARVLREEGVFAPKGALYISCIARVLGLPEELRSKELELIREIIGDVPLTGFFAGGEISNARLYGYTGLLTLFL